VGEFTYRLILGKAMAGVAAHSSYAFAINGREARKKREVLMAQSCMTGNRDQRDKSKDTRAMDELPGHQITAHCSILLRLLI